MKRRNQVIRFAFVDVDFAIWTKPWIEVSLANLVMFSTSFIFQYECQLDDQCFSGRNIGFVSMLQFLCISVIFSQREHILLLAVLILLTLEKVYLVKMDPNFVGSPFLHFTKY